MERDKYLTEAMGLCHHIFISKGEFPNSTEMCKKCKSPLWVSMAEPIFNPNFSTWQGFGGLWEWAIKQEWWYKFSIKINEYDVPVNSCKVIGWNFINPEKFSDALYKFLNERRKP